MTNKKKISEQLEEARAELREIRHEVHELIKLVRSRRTGQHPERA
jgi:hypothetical protein